MLEAIADLTVHFMTLCGMLLCLRREDHVGKFPRSGGFRSMPNLTSGPGPHEHGRRGRHSRGGKGGGGGGGRHNRGGEAAG